jgi:hypothetical protein
MGGGQSYKDKRQPPSITKVCVYLRGWTAHRNLHQQANMHAWSTDNVPFNIHLMGKYPRSWGHAIPTLHAHHA